MITLLSIITFGFFLGMRHATDADHVVAVTTFVSRERSVRGAALIGLMWGIGHTITVCVVGGAITFFGLVVPERLGMSLEFCVALMLILLGLINLRSLWRWARETTAPGASRRLAGEPATDAALDSWLDERLGNIGKRHLLRPLIVGTVHGLAGSAALALLVLPMVQKPLWAAAYLLVFGMGTIVSMMLITAAIAWPCARMADYSANLGRRLAGAAGMLSLGFGVFLVYEIGFVQGLFIH